jgi:TolB protein
MKAKWIRTGAACGFVVCVMALLSAPALASFPGSSGKIAVATLDQGIETIAPDGSGRSPLIAHAHNPAWSADGAKLAYSTQEIFVSDANGGNQIQLTSSGIRGSRDDPSWSPDGSKIVYTDTVCYISGVCGYGLMFLPSDGSGTQTPGGDGKQPAWSPRGDKIAYTSDGTHCFNPYGFVIVCNSQIFTKNVDLSGRLRLSDDTAYDYDPNWSPDGSKIVFATNRDEPHPIDCQFTYDCNVEIYVMNADGTGRTRLTNGPGEDRWPAWSPDGAKIVFSSNRASVGTGCSYTCDHDLYVMNADGTSQRRLTNTSTVQELDSDWQALPLPTPADYKNAAQFCKAERARLGESGFRARYGRNGGCVNQTRRG